MPDIFSQNNDTFHKINGKNKSINKSMFTTSDGLKLSYQYCCYKRKSINDSDNRPLVVLLKGVIGYDKNYWNCLMKKLCIVSNVYSLDFIGNGDSDTTTDSERLSLGRVTQDVLEFLDELKIDEAYFVGHGLGSVIALNIGILYPNRVIKMAISSASPRFSPQNNNNNNNVSGHNNVSSNLWEFPMKPELFNLINQSFTATNSAVLKQIIEKIYRLIDPISCYGQESFINQYLDAIDEYKLYIQALDTFDIRDSVSKVTAPVLILSGNLDPFGQSGAARFLRDIIPNSSLIEFYGQGTNIPLFVSGLYNKNIFNFFFIKCDPCMPALEKMDRKNKNKCNTCYTKCNNRIFSSKYDNLTKYDNLIKYNKPNIERSPKKLVNNDTKLVNNDKKDYDKKDNKFNILNKNLNKNLNMNLNKNINKNLNKHINKDDLIDDSDDSPTNNQNNSIIINQHNNSKTIKPKIDLHNTFRTKNKIFPKNKYDCCDDSDDTETKIKFFKNKYSKKNRSYENSSSG